MIKKIISFIVAVAVFTAADFCYSKAVDVPEVSAQCAILYCANNGEILYSKNIHEVRHIASTTKIMSALICCESGKLSKEITITDKMANVEGTSMGLLSGDKVTLRGLVFGMLLQSGNDAANSAAIAMCGSSEKFADLMNEKAKQIGMSNSHFMNPSGLTQDGHYSTCYDMALLTEYALQNDVFSSICSEKSSVVYYGNPPYRRVLTNHNKLLSTYDGVNGVKTGFTKAAGRCLVSSAQRDGIELIVVTLNAPDDWNDHAELLDYGFSVCKPIQHNIDIADIAIDVCGGTASNIKASCVGAVILSDSGDSENLVNCELYKEKFLYAPIKKGDVVGYVEVSCNGKKTAKLSLTADTDCDAYTDNTIDDKSLFQRAVDFIKNIFPKKVNE